jgi:hypothetical protein
MIRVSQQYIWSVVFSVFFLILVIMGAIILETEARLDWVDLTTFDYVIMLLASWRLTRLFVYDSLTRFLREQFMDVVKVGRGHRLETPKSGPRRLLSELFACPWCMSVWTSTVVVFLYMLTAYAVFPLVLLGLSAVVAFLQIGTNLMGHNAERAKNQSELL